jgi:NADH:ubiquinone oxidoreductase subunit
MATIGTILYTVFKGRLLGQDKFGNKYYEAYREKTAGGLKKRWVMYNGYPEPSKVPPEWHGWLHYTSNVLPDNTAATQYSWIKEPMPNLTGTSLAYIPPGHVNSGQNRAATVADYVAWKP